MKRHGSIGLGKKAMTWNVRCYWQGDSMFNCYKVKVDGKVVAIVPNYPMAHWMMEKMREDEPDVKVEAEGAYIPNIF